MTETKTNFTLAPWSKEDKAGPYNCEMTIHGDAVQIAFTRIDGKDSVAHVMIEIDKGLPRVLAYVTEIASEEPIASIHIAPDHAIVAHPGKPEIENHANAVIGAISQTTAKIATPKRAAIQIRTPLIPRK